MTEVVPNFKGPQPPKRKRKRLKPISDKRRAVIADHADVRAEVFARDRWRCQLEADLLRQRHGADRTLLERVGPCRGVLTPHHLRKASAQGTYTLENLTTLCAGHNTWVEDHPTLAAELGMVRR